MNDEMKVSTTTAIYAVTLAVVFKNMLEESLSVPVMFAPIYIFILYIILKEKGKKEGCDLDNSCPLYLWMISIALVVLAVIALYSI